MVPETGADNLFYSDCNCRRRDNSQHCFRVAISHNLPPIGQGIITKALIENEDAQSRPLTEVTLRGEVVETITPKKKKIWRELS